ncbi:MAG: Stringent starvation protein B [Methylobacteriaceae bacterium]|nr:Stringent starvation protein B [Methylobacteriaceae bacterium]
MSTDLIRYDLLVQDALKGVVRRVLGDAMRDGLPGEHHFYISFRTDHGGVRLSQRLRERYPQEMTIVLQHQYENLAVTETAFEVGLSFSGIPERLRVPFDALTGFFDPSVQFGLKFEAVEGQEAQADKPAATAATKSAVPAVKSNVPKIGPRPAPASEEPAEPKKSEGKRAKKAEPSPAEPAASAEVVSLDAFRKKS